MRRVLLPLLVGLLALALTGCGSDTSNQSSAGSGDSASDTPSESVSPSSSGPPCTADDIKVAGGFGQKPTITIPDTCSPPTTLIKKDLVPGSGPAAKAGGTVDANYLLVTWSDKQVLDNSFDRGQTFAVTPLGQANVIAGWNQGLIGMKKGTRRLLIVPPDLGYGQGGQGIAPNETLVFVVDAVNVS